MNTYESSRFDSNILFVQGTEGYFCYKIPSLLRTHSGALLAFAEARRPNCSDYAETHLVYKRSTDHGRSWSSLTRLSHLQRPGLCGAAEVVGQAVPVQLARTSSRHPDRILVPYVRNNYEPYVIHSDDDGVTFGGDRSIPGVFHTVPEGPECDRDLRYFGVNLNTVAGILGLLRSWCGGENPYLSSWREKLTGPWQFVGLGPPGSVQLASGRVLAPGYHGYVRGTDASFASTVAQLYNNFALGHVLISDDDGDSWTLGSPHGFGGESGQGANEDQMVQLGNGSIIVQSRSLATGSPSYRVQARSDDDGDTFTPTQITEDLPQVLNGVEGSLVTDGGSTLYLSQPDPAKPDSVSQKLLDHLWCSHLQLTTRERMTIWKSTDGGTSYPARTLIDSGGSGYSSMAFHNDTVLLLYEQQDPRPPEVHAAITDLVASIVAPLTSLPTRFMLMEIPAASL